MRQVSTDPASRYDVLYLTERYHHYSRDTRHVLHHVTCPARLNTVMEELLTTDLGICNTRRELFGQLFEELIRQEMIACKVSSILTNIIFRYFDRVL